MAPTVSIGAQSFEFIRRNGCFFIDKTGLIREWWENQDAVTLITRPRRFGKTLNLDMMNCFFSREYEGRGDLFEGLSIWQDEGYRKFQGSYPVIFLSFANIKGTTLEAAKKGIKHLLEKLYRIHRYVRDQACMDEKDLEFFDSVSSRMPDDVAELALQYLSDYLSRYYGQKVLILMDEYDTPLQEAFVYGYWDELVEFIRSLFNSTFKTNPYLERAVMTGITRVSKESIFSDLNNLTVVTTTSEKYSTQFGFTEEEVFKALDAFGMSAEKEKVKQWYDGFTFGSIRDIYNPWSIISFLDEKKYKPYWANTSSNGLVGKLIREGNRMIKVEFETLLQGGTIWVELDEQIVYDQLGSWKNAVWSLLLASGYLKVMEYEGYETRQGTERLSPRYELKLTNYEVYLMFHQMVQGWFAQQEDNYNAFLKAMLQGSLEEMNDYMNEIADELFSSFDTGKGPSKKAQPERFYHGFVLGLLVELKGRYEVTSNKESGLGRYDVMLEPKDKTQDAFIIEFKVANVRRKESLEAAVQSALEQIEEKDYEAVLRGKGFGKEQIRKYGFAFCGKEVLIGTADEGEKE